MAFACAVGPVAKAQAPVSRSNRSEASLLQSYAGLYAEISEPDIVLAISRDGGMLFVEGARSARHALTSQGKDRFTVPGSRIEFLREHGDVVTGMSVVTTAIGAQATMHFYTKTSGTPQRLNHFRSYTRTEVMIPTRDGVRLHAIVLRPEGSEISGDPLPIFLQRTPYGTDNNTSQTVNSTKPEMAQSGYIFVYNDIRGRYESEGQFVMNRPLVHKIGDRTDPKLIDESTDSYDVTEWLVRNLPNNNGRVGVWGVSYPGFLAMMAGIDHHPAVKAVSPQAPMTDVWMGDDFFHNGAFRQTYGFDYTQRMERTKKDVPVSMSEDMYAYFLRYGNFQNAAKAADADQLATAKHFIAEPSYTKFWSDMAIQPWLTKIEVPVLEVGGWFDQEDMYGTQTEYAALRPHDSKDGVHPSVYMVLGPWNHGGWAATTRHLGPLDFGSSTGDEYRKRYEVTFFEKYLKDRTGFDLADTATFRTGANQWERYEAWPPKSGFHAARLYLGEKHSLGFVAPRGSDTKEHASYLSDPANPVPYRERPIKSTYGVGSTWRTWLSNDQGILRDRKDILNFTSPALEQDTTITGDIVAHLYAATTGTDADWVVKLIDVYPDDAPYGMAGYQAMVVDEIFRGRYWKSFTTPTPIEVNKIKGYTWSLHGADHTFLKGHRMMVQVQSTWFPLYDRNPQTFVPNIMTAPMDAYKAQTQTVYFSAKHPSYLEVMRPDTEK
jgi:putative CocE/NonD family hydrolase